MPRIGRSSPRRHAAYPAGGGRGQGRGRGERPGAEPCPTTADHSSVLARGAAGLAGAVADVEAAGRRGLAVPTDVADADAVERAAERVEAELGPIEVWVNVAFVGSLAFFWDTTIEEFRRMTEVTYLGQVHGTRSALARMRPRDRGVVVMVGSAMNAQFQLDAFGEALLLFAAAAGHDRLESDHRAAARAAVAAIATRWQRPDAGVWELDDRAWTHSRLTCAAGLRAMAHHLPAADAAELETLADRLVADTAASSLHPSGRWQRAPDDERVDAALLLPALRGAVPADDPRSLATLAAVRDELTDDGYVYRFRHDARPLGHAEGAFTLCGFLLALAEHQQGDAVAAVRLFERNRAACGPPGLFCEEYDVTQRQLRGNLPQAFVHALMLESAVRLAGPDR